MYTKVKLNLSAIVLGMASMMGQIIIIRELIVVFYGNELSLSVILAIWLFWVAFGSFALGRLVDILKSREKLLAGIQLTTSIILPLNILFIRVIKLALNISPGEIVGFMPMFMSSFISLSFICMLFGLTFTLISKISSENSLAPSSAVGKIYLLEGLGASIGGFIYSFFLIKNLSPLENGLIAGSLNLFASILFSRNIVQLIYLITLLLSFIFNWPLYLDRFARKIQFAPFNIVESTDSIYGNITVTKKDSQFSFYENGLLLFTSGDLLTSEESVHYAMLEHPLPEKILLIGGGMAGSLKEILKHPVKGVDYVELDPLIIGLGEKYLAPIKDNRMNIVHMDGRMFVKQISTDDGRRTTDDGYDVIILNLPDPYTAMLNRFYSLEFFREIKKILAPDGVFSFSLSASENYINPENAVYLGCIYNTLEKEFQDIKILPGDNVIFLASNKMDLLTYDTDVLLKRLRERKIRTKFVREYYMPFKMNPLRIKYVESAIKEADVKKINRDFRPVGYFYHMLLWLTLFSAGIAMLPYMGMMNIYILTGVIIVLFLIVLLIQKLVKASFKMPVALSIATTGMSEISFQIITILAFQFLYGYMYYKIGIILASFMLGLVLGSFFINRRLEGIKDEKALYLKTQAFICIYPLILPLIFIAIAKINLLRPEIGKAMEASFVFLPIIAGFMGGFQFPLANKICLKGPEETGKITGFLYGIDLLGSCIGGLVVGLLLVPVLGIIETSLVLFIINTLVLALLHSTQIR
jgi:spermidine synthase